MRNRARPWKRIGAVRAVETVIHDGRPGDGIDWVSLAYLPRNVAPVIDGIALQDPEVRAQSQSGISTNQPTPVILKTPPSPSASA